MNKLTLVPMQLLFVAALAAAQAPAEDEQLKKDLSAVIALHSLPCGEVVGVTVLAEHDYVASCKDGNKYRVYLNQDGRVVVEKQK